jgi:hypothetical protein
MGMIKMPKQYQTEHDAHVLKQHAEITSSPSRHNAAKAHIKKEIGNLTKVVQPKKVK